MNTTSKNKYLISLIKTLFFCTRRKSSNCSPDESKLLLPICGTCDELDDSSIQLMFRKFDSLVLSLQLSDSSDSDITIQENENSIVGFCSGQQEGIGDRKSVV